MSWRMLMTPQAILVPNAISLTFFSISESYRLGLPILLVNFQSPLLHFFFRVLTVVLKKEYFGYLVVNFLIAETVSQSLAYRPTSFLIFAEISTWYFFGRSFVFCISSSAEAISVKVTFSVTEVKTLVIWIPSVSSLLCDFFLKYARNFSLLILVFFVQIFSSLKPPHKLQVSHTLSIDKNLHIRIPLKRSLCSPPTFLCYFTALLHSFYR